MTAHQKFSEEQQQKILSMKKAGLSVRHISRLIGCADRRIKLFLDNQDSYNKEEFFKRLNSPASRRQKSSHSVSIDPGPFECEEPPPNFPDAACKSHDIELWYPHMWNDMTKNERIAVKNNIELAQKICRSCKHQVECLDYALLAEPFGVWGGTTEAERLILRNRFNIQCKRNGKVFIAGAKNLTNFGTRSSDDIEARLSPSGLDYVNRMKATA